MRILTNITVRTASTNGKYLRTKDRGGLPTILALIEKTKHAIAITCIDPWDDKYSKLRKQCLLIEFQALKKENMFNYLKNIADAESIQYQEKDLLDIIKLSKGDMRAAITDIQTYSITKTINTEEKSERDREESMQYCLRKILKSKKWEETINVFDKVDEDREKITVLVSIFGRLTPVELSFDQVKK